MEHLDLSDNRAGLSPWGSHSSEGIRIFANKLSQSFHMKILKLARNCLDDEDVTLIGNAVKSMPTMQVLDLSGNYCQSIGMEAIQDLILGHSNLDVSNNLGITDLDMSCNPIGDAGVQLLNAAVERSNTLTALKIAACGIQDDAMNAFQKSMAKNSTIVWLDLQSNRVKDIVELRACAEAEANKSLKNIRRNPQSVDADKLTKSVYR